jgi:REP element-mobilizing transposase RayT
VARALRIEFPQAVYHVMNRGIARQRVFHEAADYDTFFRVLDDCHRRWGLLVFAYCLMGNHYHLCVRTPEGNLHRIMRHLNGLYTQRFNRAHGRDGPLFRGRYKAILVEADQYLAAVVRYLHLNPVAAKLVETPEAYPWSSHAAYLHPQGVPSWLGTHEVLEGFPSRRAFHEFVLAGNEPALTAFYAAGRQMPVLGTDSFRDRLVRLGRAVSREHPRHERVAVRPSAEQVLQRVARVFGVAVETLRRSRRGHPQDARKVAMYLVHRLCDLTLAETARRFGVSSYGTVAWACHHVGTRIATEGRWHRQVAQIEQAFSQPKT